MLKIDAEAFEEQIQSLILDLKSRIEKGVEKFVLDITYVLIDDTPYGNTEAFYDLYVKRQELYGFDIKPGLAKGSWLVSTGSLELLGALAYDKPNGYLSKIRAQQTTQEYIIGDDVYITNSIPYIGELNKGSSKQLPEGFKVSVDKIETIYAMKLSKYFKKPNTKIGKVERK